MNAQRHERGSTLVEGAVTITLLFMLLFAIIEFGRAYNLYQAITDAAREGARYSVAPYTGTSNLPTPSDVQTHVEAFLGSDNISGGQVTVNQAVSQVSNGITTTYTQVDVSAPFQFLYFPFGTITMNTHAVMRNETN
jgi:Flp pilus assembly protein TadG